MIFMKIIKKRIGYYPEVLDLDKDKIDEIFNSGMDKTNIVGNVYLISRYQLDKNEKTFNTSVIFPHTNIVHYYNDIYIIKKGLLGYRSLMEAEIEDLLGLLKYPDNLKDPVTDKRKEKVTEEKPEVVDTPKEAEPEPEVEETPVEEENNTEENNG